MRYRDMMERLLANSVIDQQSDCWYWIGKIENGYGLLTTRIPGRRSPVNRRAHRVSFEVFKGRKIRSGFEISHECHHSLCINPNHLKERKHIKNIHLRDEQRRMRLSVTNGHAWLRCDDR